MKLADALELAGLAVLAAALFGLIPADLMLAGIAIGLVGRWHHDNERTQP